MDNVRPLKDANEIHTYGGKAANLAKLLRAGFAVPDGFVVGLGAFDQDGRLKWESKERIEDLLGPEKVYAVRSSALAEDAIGASWAGQFETFLNTKARDVITKIEACHSSIKARARARAYAGTQSATDRFQIAVIIQEMIEPTYAGLIFTKDPSTGANRVLIEYIRGIGEPLVHGDVDPERIIWNRSTREIKEHTEEAIPIPYRELVSLAEKVETAFGGVPQDIEWALDNRQLWLVQTRPITTLQDRGIGKHYLGEPSKLFYWGPSRATPLYMSDFTKAATKFFADATESSLLPDPPKTLVLFHNDKVVWLIEARSFGKFVNDMFRVYEHSHDVKADKSGWQEATRKLDHYCAEARQPDVKKVNKLFEAAWQPTLMAEFSLYGAEAVLHKRLERFESKARQEIWGGMTLPDEPTFMQHIDIELAASDRPARLAIKYPWIQDGYYGVAGNATTYFRNRLKIVRNNVITEASSPQKRADIIKKYGLKKSEIKALELTRELSVFMDDRKAWMMRTRRYIQRAAQIASRDLKTSSGKASSTTLDNLALGKLHPYFGSTFLKGRNIQLTADDVALAWDWYVEFRASHTVLKGIVASSGGRHFMNGEVFVAHSPQDAMPDNAVLVAPSTSPSYVPLMRRARALVTDHGGMMSHAAIVAREFRLPCVVGTKRATKILKDGDKVVLDLVKGEVNK